MIVTQEISLEDFEFQGGATGLAECLTPKEFAIIEAILEDSYPNGCSATFINDLFWHDEETIADWLGEDLEDILNRDL